MTFENPPNVMKLFRSSSCSFVSAMWLVSFSMGVTHDEDTVRHLPQLRGLTARSALVAPLGQQQVVDGKRRLRPLRHPGDMIEPLDPASNAGKSHQPPRRHRYRLKEFVRVRGDKPFLEACRVDPVFFTMALEEPRRGWPESEEGQDGSSGGSGGSPSSSSRSSSRRDLPLLPGTIQEGDQGESDSAGEESTCTTMAAARTTVLNTQDSIGGSNSWNWRLRQRTNRGSHGEVWRGTRVEDEDEGEEIEVEDTEVEVMASRQHERESGNSRQRERSPPTRKTKTRRSRRSSGTTYVLKRMLLEKGDEVRRAAAREIFFGEQFRNQTTGGGRGLDDDDAVSNNQLSRFVESFTTADGELWLVFVDEGRSVHEVRDG